MLSAGFKQVHDVVEVTDKVLGGQGHTLKLLLEIMAARKVMQFGRAIQNDLLPSLRGITRTATEATGALTKPVRRRERGRSLRRGRRRDRCAGLELPPSCARGAGGAGGGRCRGCARGGVLTRTGRYINAAGGTRVGMAGCSAAR